MRQERAGKPSVLRNGTAAALLLILLTACCSTPQRGASEPVVAAVDMASAVPTAAPDPVPETADEEAAAAESPPTGEREAAGPESDEAQAETTTAAITVAQPETAEHPIEPDRATAPVPNTAPAPAPVAGTTETPTAPESKPRAADVERPPAAASPAAPRPAAEAGAPAVEREKPAAAAPKPAMDLEDLEQRLRKTKAIGLFTKLEIKSEVENLLKEVRDYHDARSRLGLAQLQERFNLLVMKLLVLLEDGDPQLRHDLAQARPALWTTLADPHQFASIKGP